MGIIHRIGLISLLSALLFVGGSDGGLLFGAATAGTCGGVCGAGFAICTGAASVSPAVLEPNTLTAPFASVLRPWLANGCWTGFGMCYATCVGGALMAPTA